MTTLTNVARWPFMFVVDGQGNSTGWLVIHAPVRSHYRQQSFVDYRRLGFGFIGMCSFMDFPLGTEDDPLDYGAVCEGWCHCYRTPEAFLPKGFPHVLLSLSDFIDPQIISPTAMDTAHDVPAFDVVYVGDMRPWKMVAKNWELAQRCLPRLCDELGLRVLVIGMSPEVVPAIRGITVWPWLPQIKFLQVLSRSRMLFVPNELDASPRIMAEALCLNVPLLTNRKILGGWKYVTVSTGTFFNNADDVTEAAYRCLSGEFQPRSWFIKYYGPQHAGQTLLQLIQKVDPSCVVRDTLSLANQYTVDGRH